jgi:hypothetical protein
MAFATGIDGFIMSLSGAETMEAMILHQVVANCAPSDV